MSVELNNLLQLIIASGVRTNIVKDGNYEYYICKNSCVSFGTLKQKFAAVVNKILYVCLSICQGVTMWEMLNGLSWTVVWGGSATVYRHTIVLVKIEW